MLLEDRYPEDFMILLWGPMEGQWILVEPAIPIPSALVMWDI